MLYSSQLSVRLTLISPDYHQHSRPSPLGWHVLISLSGLFPFVRRIRGLPGVITGLVASYNQCNAGAPDHSGQPRTFHLSVHTVHTPALASQMADIRPGSASARTPRSGGVAIHQRENNVSFKFWREKIVSVWPLQSFQHRTFHTCHMWGFHETDKIKLMTKVWSGVGVDKKHLLEIFIHPHAKWNDEILLLKKIDGSICYWDTTQR